MEGTGSAAAAAPPAAAKVGTHPRLRALAGGPEKVRRASMQPLKTNALFGLLAAAEVEWQAGDKPGDKRRGASAESPSAKDSKKKKKKKNKRTVRVRDGGETGADDAPPTAKRFKFP